MKTCPRHLPAGQPARSRRGNEADSRPTPRTVTARFARRGGQPARSRRGNEADSRPTPRTVTARFARRAGQRAFTLLECLAYLATIVVVLGLATMALNNCWDTSYALRRNADDIVRALHAGDQWRADVRAATGPITVTEADGAQQLRIPAPAGEIIYSFSKGQLRRQTTSPESSSLWLSNVKSSHMQSDLRARVSAWRWELELASAPKKSQTPPLFTFESVAGSATNR